MAIENLLAFLLAATIIELTPGPNMGYLALVSLGEGRRAGLMTFPPEPVRQGPSPRYLANLVCG